MIDDRLPGVGMPDNLRREYDRELRGRYIQNGVIKPFIDCGFTSQPWRDDPTLRLDRVVRITQEPEPKRYW
jgi:hypothetical protein